MKNVKQIEDIKKVVAGIPGAKLFIAGKPWNKYTDDETGEQYSRDELNAAGAKEKYGTAITILIQ